MDESSELIDRVLGRLGKINIHAFSEKDKLKWLDLLKKMRKYRKDRKMSASDFAREAKVNLDTYIYIEYAGVPPVFRYDADLLYNKLSRFLKRS